MVRTTTRLSSSGLVMAFVFLSLCRVRSAAQAAEPSPKEDNDNSSASIETYNVEERDSACPFMSSLGSSILSGIADSPNDASVLEEAAGDPSYGAVKEVVTYHHRGVNTFIAVLWGLVFFFGILMLMGIVHVLYRMITDSFEHRVTPYYMAAFIFTVVVIAILLVMMVLIFICLIGSRGALVDSAVEKVPAVYASTFDNLRKFARVTAATGSDGGKAGNRLTKVAHTLGDGFSEEFEAFIAERAMADGKSLLFRAARDCANDTRYLVRARIADGHVWHAEDFKSPSQHCAHVRHTYEQLFGKVARAVANYTVQYRQELADVLNDLFLVAEARNGDAALTSVESVNRLQNSVDEYEASKGVFGSLVGNAQSSYFWLNIFFLVCIVALLTNLLMGLAVHDKLVEPQNRSQASHIIGFLIVITAVLLGVFVIIAIFNIMYLVIESTLGYCHVCAPYIDNRFAVLDDSIERLWPSRNRSFLLSKATPSKIMGDCANDSIVSPTLSPKLTHRKVLTRNFYRKPAPRLWIDYDLHENSTGRHRDSTLADRDNSPFDEIPSTSDESALGLMYPTWTSKDTKSVLSEGPRLSETSIRLYEAGVEEALLRTAPVYFSRFVDKLADAMHSSATMGAGRCSTLRSVFTSFMDVVCYTYVLELVGYWAGLLLATLVAIIVIPFCCLLSMYFFRTKRKKRKHQDRHVPSSSASSPRLSGASSPRLSGASSPRLSGASSPPLSAAASSVDEEETLTVTLTLPPDTPEPPEPREHREPPEYMRRIVYQSRSNHYRHPFAPYVPCFRRQASLTPVLSRIPLQHIRRFYSTASLVPAGLSGICHHHHPSLAVGTVAAPVHSPSCVVNVPLAPAVFSSGSHIVERTNSHSLLRTGRLSCSAQACTSHLVPAAPAPPVMCASAAAPALPVVVSAPPSPPVAAVPVSVAPCEKQQATTANTTINIYGSPAGGIGVPAVGYTAGFPAAGYATLASQPQYLAASTAGAVSYAAAPAAPAVATAPVVAAVQQPYHVAVSETVSSSGSDSTTMLMNTMLPTMAPFSVLPALQPAHRAVRRVTSFTQLPSLYPH